jgi:hypothetical protein
VYGDVIGRGESDQLSLDSSYLVPTKIAYHQGVVQGEELALHLKYRLPRLIGDSRVFAKVKELFADDVTHACASSITSLRSSLNHFLMGQSVSLLYG